MSISVITLTYNKLDVTRRCLPTLLNTAPGLDWELIVVENGSRDGTREWLAEFTETAKSKGVPVRVLANDQNVGCSPARNQGAAAARGDLLVFMDNDVALRSRSWLRRLSVFLNAEPRAALVGPKLIYPYPPYAIQCAGVGISKTGKVQFRGRGEPGDDVRFSQRREVQCLISACWMMRRAQFAESGGFDPAYNPVQFEDFDLCYRLRAKGWQSWYLPAVEMYHVESVTTAGTAGLSNARNVIRNGMLFKQRWKQLFEQEDGPADADTRWRPIPPTDLATIQELPLVD